MDIQRSGKRKTVKWNAQDLQTKILVQNQNQTNLQKNLTVQQLNMQKKKQLTEKSEEYQGNSQKTIEVEASLQNARLNRVSLQIKNPMNLNQINKRISINYQMLKCQQMQEEQQFQQKQNSIKDQDFQNKRKMFCNQFFALKKNK